MAKAAKAAEDAIDRAMREKGYKQTGGPAPTKWEEGLEVEGRYLKLIPARDQDSSPVLVLEVDGYEVRYYAPKILEDRLLEAAVGDQLYIVCLGKIIPSKKGSKAWGFKVGVIPAKS